MSDRITNWADQLDQLVHDAIGGLAYWAAAIALMFALGFSVWFVWGLHDQFKATKREFEQIRTIRSQQ